MASTKLSCCCISHEFLKAVAKTPHKIAVIHATGGARIARELRSNHGSSDTEGSDIKYDKLFTDLETAPSSSPLYDGDQGFTFSEILAAVDCLSSRLRNILDGGDDPYLVRPPTGSIFRGQSEYAYFSWCSKSSSPSITKKSSGDQHIYTPKVLGVCMVPSVEYIVTVLSVLRCGEAFTPIDPLWPKEKISSLVSASNIDLLIRCNSSLDGTGSSKLDKFDGLIDSGGCLELFISMEKNYQQKFRSENLCWPCESGRSREFCYLMYTSGSTGKPKGVCGTETGLMNRYTWMQELYPLSGDEILLFKTSISFIDHLQEFLGALLTTCSLVIPPFCELKQNPYLVYDFLQLYSINRLIAVPSLMRLIVPALQSHHCSRVRSSLKLLVLSGENFPLALWEMLHKLLPSTTILNLYGSTEVSGDCSYFDCERLPPILECETLTSVPIGMPILNCDLVIVEEGEDQGALYVGGLCIAAGYYCDTPQRSTKFSEDLSHEYSFCELKNQLYFKTGDYARRIQSGDLVFMGRKDRTVKINGQRMALEEIEGTLRRYPGVVNAAVVSNECEGEITLLEAYLVTTEKKLCNETLRSSIRTWMMDKLPLAMIPNCFYFTESIPITSTGKVDYTLLASLKSLTKGHQIETYEMGNTLLQIIKKAFCDVLMVEMVSDDDDFFAIGGNSISAAHASHTLGIDMRMLYAFHSPFKLQKALLEEGLCSVSVIKEDKLVQEGMFVSCDSKTPNTNLKRHEGITGIPNCKFEEYPIKRCKVDSDVSGTSNGTEFASCYPWNSISSLMPCAISRCNKVFHEDMRMDNGLHQETSSIEIPRSKGGSVKELWKVHTSSCVDASPLVVFIAGEIFIFIGSHSSKFLCISAKSGVVCWEIKLDGRIECSAVVLGNFSQVVVGCYKGNIYFLDLFTGDILWSFQTGGEVKSQPLVDKYRNLVWCGSHDHNLYALDYKNHCCVYKLQCGGSIFGSPVIDEVQNLLYVASTSGRVTAISIKEMPFSNLWMHELEAPVFGSLSINSCNGNGKVLNQCPFHHGINPFVGTPLQVDPDII